MGAGDEVPAAITQLGARVEFLQSDDLAWGDLSRFPVIVTGVRAYEKRADLRANNARLLDYVRSGGRLIVQYNKLEFNAAQYGPHTAQVSSDRVTDETAPVRILEPADPLLTTPEQDHGRGLERVGPGARPVLPGRARLSVPRAAGARGSVPEQRRIEARGARRRKLRQGAMGVRRPRACGVNCLRVSTARTSCSPISSAPSDGGRGRRRGPGGSNGGTGARDGRSNRSAARPV